MDKLSYVGPPRTLELFRMFLDASSKGEHAVLILETKKSTVTSKFRCVETFAGTPVEDQPKIKKRKVNSARARRSQLRLEQFQQKKEKETKVI